MTQDVIYFLAYKKIPLAREKGPPVHGKNRKELEDLIPWASKRFSVPQTGITIESMKRSSFERKRWPK